MANYRTTDTALTSIANAIRTKGGTSASLSYPSGFVSAIQALPEGGTLTESDVNFYDYDGTLVAAKTKTEINAMSSDSDLPANPTHSGLTAQGWNWTVAQLKAQLTAMPNQSVVVGQNYITTSGATEIDITLSDASHLSPTLIFATNGTVVIDWGDGSATDSVTGSSQTTIKYTKHVYSSTGNYTISLSISTGTLAFYNSASSAAGTLRQEDKPTSRIYNQCITAVRFGSNVKLAYYGFAHCYSLKTVTLPTSAYNIEGGIFYECISLKTLILPSGVSGFLNGDTLNYCLYLETISIPASFRSMYGFENCYSLKNFTIPTGVTRIEQSAFANCYDIENIEIPSTVTAVSASSFSSCRKIQKFNFPSGITQIAGSVISNCYSLKEVEIPSTVVSISSYAFSGCMALKNITIPNNVISIEGNAFAQCNSAKHITLSNKLETIGNSAFANCKTVENIIIPATVTSIGTNAFYSADSLSELHLEPISPPTLSNSNTFYNLPSACIIYVPRGYLTTYQTANIWSNWSTKMQEEPV